MRKRGRVCGVRWCVRRTMRARIDGRVMVVGRRAPAAHQVATASAGSEWTRAHAPGQTRPAPALDPHAPLLPRGRLGLGCGVSGHSSPNVGAWTSPGQCYTRRGGCQALRSRCPHASRYINTLITTATPAWLTTVPVRLARVNLNTWQKSTAQHASFSWTVKKKSDEHEVIAVSDMLDCQVCKKTA